MSEDPNVLDLTKDGVQFARWRTAVENDDLSLVSMNLSDGRTLTAIFKSEQRGAKVAFTFHDARAFRVLDEGGLLELWEASSKNPRPAQSTFRVRGHMWQSESPLAWIHGTAEPYFSYMIATDWDCLEVVSFDPPDIRLD